MSLIINIHRLEKKALLLEGELTAEEMQWDTRDEMIRLNQPLFYKLEVQRLEQNILAQGQLRQVLDCICVRCLNAFEHAVVLDHWSCLLPLEGEEKAEVINDGVDLTPYIRDDIFLAFPQHPVCGSQCEGLAPRQENEAQGRSWKSGSAASVWADLDKLKLE
jgi:uncharacterized metal-binding protein YceD (DUF177 family)